MMFKNFSLIIWCGSVLIVSPASLQAQQGLLPQQLTGYNFPGQDVSGLLTNAASLARSHAFSAGAYSEKTFLLEELSYSSMGMVLPTSSGNFALIAVRYGSRLVGQTDISLAYGRKLGQVVDAGVRFHYNMIQAKNYGNFSSACASVSARFHISETFRLGIQMAHLAGIAFGDKEGRLPGIYSLGLGWDVSENFLLAGEMRKEEDQPPDIRMGVVYLPHQRIELRLAFASSLNSFVTGAGIWFHDFRIDLNSSLHPQLGFSPGLGLTYRKKKDKNK